MIRYRCDENRSDKVKSFIAKVLELCIKYKLSISQDYEGSFEIEEWNEHDHSNFGKAIEIYRDLSIEPTYKIVDRLPSNKIDKDILSYTE